MVDHLQYHLLGSVHFGTAILAMLAGAAVVISRKGTARHKLLGRIYLALMILMNGTAFLIYELFGRFGVFHWLAVFSLATLLAGYLPAKLRGNRWMFRHAVFMAVSYIGLLAAAVAEVAGRVPSWSFGISVFASAVLVIVIGTCIAVVSIPKIIRAIG